MPSGRDSFRRNRVAPCQQYTPYAAGRRPSATVCARRQRRTFWRPSCLHGHARRVSLLTGFCALSIITAAAFNGRDQTRTGGSTAHDPEPERSRAGSFQDAARQPRKASANHRGTGSGGQRSGVGVRQRSPVQFASADAARTQRCGIAGRLARGLVEVRHHGIAIGACARRAGVACHRAAHSRFGCARRTDRDRICRRLLRLSCLPNVSMLPPNLSSPCESVESELPAEPPLLSPRLPSRTRRGRAPPPSRSGCRRGSATGRSRRSRPLLLRRKS